MTDLIVIVPTRGRPEAAHELVDVFAATCTADTYLCFALDKDDPKAYDYPVGWAELPNVGVSFGDTHNMGEALHDAAREIASPPSGDPPFAVAFMGDDHRPRTVGWDKAYLDALREFGTGIVYGNDLLQGERLPTQVAMTSDIVRALGYMAPPALKHLYLDDFWKTLGNAAGCLRYLPDVVVEHVHPLAGKASWDENYARVNSSATYEHDRAVFEEWRRTSMAQDVAKVRALRTPDERHEWRLFEEGTIPEWTTPQWYEGREHAPHLEQIGHRDRLMFTAAQVAHEAMAGNKGLVDLGAGDGGLLSLLGPAIRAWGYDLQPTNLAAAKQRGVDVRYGNVLTDDIEWGDIAVATEMLEHLVDPHGFVRKIAEHSKVLICSSPRLETADQHYEFHTWAWDAVGYRTLLESNGWRVKRHVPIHGFQVIVAARA